jgi:transcriptional regulator with XRE-family HTH domain
MNIATRLDEAMTEAGFKSQMDLSRASGVPQPTINRILKGSSKRGPESDTVIKLATACNVNFDWLNQNKGPKTGPGTATSTTAPHAINEPSTLNAVNGVPEFLRYWLDVDEANFLAQYRSLTPRSRVRIRAIIGQMKRDDVSLEDADKL